MQFASAAQGVDIFEKAFVAMPICGDGYWSLGILCFLGRTAGTRAATRRACAQHLDSLGRGPSSAITGPCHVTRKGKHPIAQLVRGPAFCAQRLLLPV